MWVDHAYCIPMTICRLSGKSRTTKLFSIISRERKKKLGLPSFTFRAWNDYLKNTKNCFNYSENRHGIGTVRLNVKNTAVYRKLDERKENTIERWHTVTNCEIIYHLWAGMHAWSRTKIEIVINVNRCTVSDSVATPLDDDWTRNTKHAPYGLWKWRTGVRDRRVFSCRI